MRNVFITTVCLLLLVLSNAETFERAKLRGYGRTMSTESVFTAMKNSEFGKDLLNMLTLKFQTSQNLQRLTEILEDLEEQIRNQQNTEDTEYEAKSTAYTDTINAQEAIQAEATQNIANDEAALTDRNENLRQATAARALLLAEQQQTQNFLDNLEQARARDQDQYDNRVRNTNLLLQGLAKVIQIFQGSTNNQELDQDTVNNLLGLLNNIQASLQASLADDATANDRASQQYTTFKDNTSQRLAQIASNVSQLDLQISGLEADISQLQTNLETENIRKANAEQLEASTEQVLQELKTKYTGNKSVRLEQIRLLGLVNARLEENPEDVQAVLNRDR